MATLSYFDIFDYPLTRTEIAQFLKRSYARKEFNRGLDDLVTANWVYKFADFYTLHENYWLVHRRMKENAKANAILKSAEKIAGFLSAFPFVKGVAIQGLHFKGPANHNQGIEFLIIAERNKLWLARTFIQTFKKLLLPFKKEHGFSTNCYIDEEMLEIREKNIYTATEIATLLPLRGIKIFDKFFQHNKWGENFLPNHKLRISYLQETRNPILKRIVQLILRNSIGSMLEHVFMKAFVYCLSFKTISGKLNTETGTLTMDVGKHYAKPNSQAFQKNFMKTYEKKIVTLFCRYESKAMTVF